MGPRVAVGEHWVRLRVRVRRGVAVPGGGGGGCVPPTPHGWERDGGVGRAPPAHLMVECRGGLGVLIPRWDGLVSIVVLKFVLLTPAMDTEGGVVAKTGEFVGVWRPLRFYNIRWAVACLKFEATQNGLACSPARTIGCE